MLPCLISNRCPFVYISAEKDINKVLDNCKSLIKELSLRFWMMSMCQIASNLFKEGYNISIFERGLLTSSVISPNKLNLVILVTYVHLRFYFFVPWNQLLLSPWYQYNPHMQEFCLIYFGIIGNHFLGIVGRLPKCCCQLETTVDETSQIYLSNASLQYNLKAKSMTSAKMVGVAPTVAARNLKITP